MNQLLTTVLPLALGAAVSPTLLTAAVLVLSTKIAPRARAWALVLGAVVAMIALTVAAPIVANAIHSLQPVVVDRADVIAGALLLLLALRSVLRKHNSAEAAKKRAPSQTTATKPRLFAYVGFGILLIAVDFSSTILYLVALKDIGNAHIPQTVQLLVLAIPFFAVIAPALIPTALSTVAPKRSDELLKPLAAWTSEHSNAIAAVISLVFGLYLVAKGLPPLLK
jgi:threonine/homoserine/homoserine lactone efflux protein